MACDKQPSFGSLLEQLIVAPYAMRIDLGKRVLERVEAQVAELTLERDEARAVMMIQDEPDYCPRCEALMDGDSAATSDICHDCWNHLESEVTRLNEALAAAQKRAGEYADDANAAEARVRELDTECTSHVQDTLRLSEECAALRAEVAEANKAAVYSAQREQAAESSLAAANALLVEAQDSVHSVPGLRARIDAHLAAQPATAPGRTPDLDPVVTKMLELQDRIEAAEARAQEADPAVRARRDGIQ